MEDKLLANLVKTIARHNYFQGAKLVE